MQQRMSKPYDRNLQIFQVEREPRVKKKKIKELYKNPDLVAQLVRASYLYAKDVGLIPGQGIYKRQQVSS